MMMKAAFGSVLAVSLAGSASAAILWDQGALTTTSYSAGWSLSSTGQSFSDLVEFSSTVDVNGLNWWTTGSAIDTWHVQIQNDSGGTPGSVVTGFDVSVGTSGVDSSGYYKNEMSFSPVTLGSGRYWIYAAPNGGNGQLALTPATTSLADSMMAQYNSGYAGGYSYMTSTVVGDAAFQVLGEVPAPGSLALLGLGGLAAARRRR